MIRVITTLILFITIINISNCNQSNSDFIELLYNVKIRDDSNLQRSLPLPKSEIAKFDNVNQEMSLTDLEENPVNTPSDVQNGGETGNNSKFSASMIQKYQKDSDFWLGKIGMFWERKCHIDNLKKHSEIIIFWCSENGTYEFNERRFITCEVWSLYQSVLLPRTDLIFRNFAANLRKQMFDDNPNSKDSCEKRLCSLISASKSLFPLHFTLHILAIYIIGFLEVDFLNEKSSAAEENISF